MGLDTSAVLEAANTKWNFLPFKPGLVGGHCIGVDPYYLTYKAQTLGYHPEIILAGRRLNDSMGKHVVNTLIKKLLVDDIVVNQAKILVLGYTFKENCPDIRNTKVFDIVIELLELGINVEIYDPYITPESNDDERLCFLEVPSDEAYDAIMICVAHDEFKALDEEWIKQHAKKKHVLFDLKGVLSKKLGATSL